MSVIYTRTYTKTQYAEDGWTYINFPALTPGAGETFVRWKAEQSSGSAQVELRDTGFTPRTWGEWYSDKSLINCGSSWDQPRIQARFNSSTGRGTINVTYLLTVEFTDGLNQITVNAGEGGAASASAGSATAGTTVTITCSPSTGYSANTPTASGVTFTPAGANRWTFTMPAGAVTVSCTFSKIAYTITTIANPAGAGTISVSQATANYGDVITISQTPAANSYFNGWVISPAATISGGQFTMPAANVTLTANYLIASTCTLSADNLTGGGTVTLNIVPDKAAYSHKYSLSFGTNMELGPVTVPAGTTTVTIQVPDTWSQQIPSAASKSGGVLTLETYNGEQGIGTYQLTGLVYKVPESAVPQIGTITTAIERTIGGISYSNVGDIYVQGKCGVRVQASAAGALGSSVTGMEVSISGYTDADHSAAVSAAAVDWTSGLLTVSGTAVITVKATDSRGRTASGTATITVAAYNRPGGTLAVRRVDSSRNVDPFGTYATYDLTKNYTQVGTNTLSWSLKCNGVTASSPADSGDLLPGNRQSFSQTDQYTIELILQDAFELVTIQVILPTAQFMIFLNATGDRMAFKKATNETLDKHGKDNVIEFSGDSQIYIGTTTLEDYIQGVINGTI